MKQKKIKKKRISIAGVDLNTADPVDSLYD